MVFKTDRYGTKLIFGDPPDPPRTNPDPPKQISLFVLRFFIKNRMFTLTLASSLQFHHRKRILREKLPYKQVSNPPNTQNDVKYDLPPSPNILVFNGLKTALQFWYRYRKWYWYRYQDWYQYRYRYRYRYRYQYRGTSARNTLS